MIIRKNYELCVVTERGDRVIVRCLERITHKYEVLEGSFEVDNKSQFIMEYFKRPARKAQRIVDSNKLVDKFLEELMSAE